MEYWTEQLADSTPAELLTDFPRPSILSGNAGKVPVSIEGSLYDMLRVYSRTHQVTSFAILLAAFRAAHFRLTGSDNATIGVPSANRNRPELENMIGFFVNTQCIRITIDENDSFESLVRQVRSTTTATQDNQDVPFEQVVSSLMPSSSRDASRNPLVQLMFALHGQQDLFKIQLEGTEEEVIPTEEVTRFDIEFHLHQGDGKLSGDIIFAADLFEAETIRGVVRVFEEVLRRGLQQPQTLIMTMPLTDGIPELDRMGLLDMVKTEYPRDMSVVDVFRQQVRLSANDTAIVDSSSRMSYAELDQRSDQVAAWLCQRQLPAETFVAVLAPRSCEAIIALFGILKAGHAYLPLDVNVPAARLRAILAEVKGEKLVLLGAGEPSPEGQSPEVSIVRIADATSPVDPVSLRDGKSKPTADSLAYVIFTSGSTGQPKGVMIEHRGVLRLVKQTNILSGLSPAQTFRMAHMSNLAFDASIWEVFTALLNGGSLICIDRFTILDAQALEALFLEERINMALFPPRPIETMPRGCSCYHQVS